MNANTGKTIFGTLLPLVTNPTALAAIGIGAAGWAIYSLFTEPDKSENNEREAVANGSEPLKQPLAPPAATVDMTVPERLETVNPAVPATVDATDDEPHPNGCHGHENKAGESAELRGEQAKKEMIRRIMSELGKRSAAARTRRTK